eukprot:gene13721-11232_t
MADAADGMVPPDGCECVTANATGGASLAPECGYADSDDYDDDGDELEGVPFCAVDPAAC